jgi:RNA polymerase sigma factor (sigma-70 family)
MAHRDRFRGRFDEVLAAARRDERWALEEIYRALGQVVINYLRAQGSAEPEDLASEVFVGLLRNLHTFDGDEAGFRSWVFTIAHRRLQDERRRLHRQPPLIPIAEAPDSPAPDDVEGAVTHSLDAELVRAICARLAPDQRDVVLLRLLGQLPIDDVATALGKSPGAVKALQRRGLLAIGRLLEREEAYQRALARR